MRSDWLDWGLSTAPADRPAAEAAIAELYRHAGRSAPSFVWAASPPAAVRTIDELGLSARSSFAGYRYDDNPARIAALIGSSRERMLAQVRARRPAEPHFWWDWHDDDSSAPTFASALLAGAQYSPRPHRDDVYAQLASATWGSVSTTIIDGIVAPLRKLVPPHTGQVHWYGQHEAHRLAYFTILGDLDLVRYSPTDDELLGIQTRLARACGWWWPFDDHCVIAERPRAVHTEETPDAAHGQRRLHHPDTAALAYSDGTEIFAIHGTVVPDWVITDPATERILRETNVEVRRTAIERLGWDRYVDEAQFRLLDRCDDPGNPDSVLELYETPAGWSKRTRVLLAVNGSRERDGTRRRYGLNVPSRIESALDAAGWTYGLPGTVYAGLLRRT